VKNVRFCLCSDRLSLFVTCCCLGALGGARILLWFADLFSLAENSGIRVMFPPPGCACGDVGVPCTLTKCPSDTSTRDVEGREKRDASLAR